MRPTILTPDQRVRVFISSTLDELAAERVAVRDAVDRMRLVPVMFEQGARPHPPRDLYRAYVEQSQIFVGVYGESYGWIAPGERISGLEDELGLAEALPRLIYVREPADHRDPRLTAMLDAIGSDAVSYRRFRTAAELREKVEHDLAGLLSARFERAARPPAQPTAGRLPAFRTALVGRDDDLAALEALLTDETVPLVTLTGTGGIGKTRLAVAAAGRAADRFRDGARFVDLSAARSPDLVGEALARGLGVRTSGATPAATDVGSWLRTKHLLLVIDNFEQLADAAPVIAELLRTAPQVTALVTSRSSLRLGEEQVYPVPPLSGPIDSTDPAAVAASSAAVRLFVETARASSPGFTLTPDNLDAVVEISRRLAGLPLAIVLAAAKVRVLPPAAIVEHLGDELGLLTGGPRDLPDRQRTLRATITWSYRLLRADERAMFDRLAVFAGGWDLEAAEAVTRPDGDVLDLLEALIESTLVRRDTTPDGQPRFSMLDTIRGYALERLRAGADWTAAHQVHADHYLRLGQEAQAHLNRADGTGWLHRLEREHDNLDAAVDWFLDQDDPGSSLRLLWDTWTFWWRRGHVDEAGRHLTRILDRQHLLSHWGLGRALLAVGGTAIVSGLPERAEELLSRALAVVRAGGDDATLTVVLGTYGQFLAQQGERERARRYLIEAGELSITAGEGWQNSLVHSRLALLALEAGEAEEAWDNVRVALDLASRGQQQFTALIAHYTWALCANAAGDPIDARQHLVDGLGLAADAGDEAALSTFLGALGDIDSRDGDLTAAVRLAAAAQALRTPSNEMWMRAFTPSWPPMGLDPAAARAELGGDRYDAAWRAGEALGVDRAIALAT
ncbi:hypothetical protein Ais01nite_65850 [Asanoa ishikariensis]|uniref:Predicted ATPase n=1 Tax=Asanoa ishikariensis TaxID=137265 RepID=A0A1H3NKW5_9ACTN|nr:DUF4062 domain-containing protein [Asanoa ishikariensis]GIF68550.1 hypothetical protein Ais01nite_65850 [Asanoa ishikariensis]SDY89458.1 Predicted ATPase [Asanoa ishikariensis]